MKLKDSVLQQIKKNDECRRALMEIHNIKETSVLRWLRENKRELTLYASLKIISQYLNTDIDSMIIYEEHDFKQVI